MWELKIFLVLKNKLQAFRCSLESKACSSPLANSVRFFVFFFWLPASSPSQPERELVGVAVQNVKTAFTSLTASLPLSPSIAQWKCLATEMPRWTQPDYKMCCGESSEGTHTLLTRLDTAAQPLLSPFLR